MTHNLYPPDMQGWMLPYIALQWGMCMWLVQAVSQMTHVHKRLRRNIYDCQ